MSAIKKYYKVYVNCTGIKKRCRKPDFHSFQMIERDYVEGEKPSPTDHEIAQAKLHLAANMKSVQRADIQYYETEYDGMFETMKLSLDGKLKYALNI